MFSVLPRMTGAIRKENFSVCLFSCDWERRDLIRPDQLILQSNGEGAGRVQLSLQSDSRRGLVYTAGGCPQLADLGPVGPVVLPPNSISLAVCSINNQNKIRNPLQKREEFAVSHSQLQ